MQTSPEGDVVAALDAPAYCCHWAAVESAVRGVHGLLSPLAHLSNGGWRWSFSPTV